MDAMQNGPGKMQEFVQQLCGLCQLDEIINIDSHQAAWNLWWLVGCFCHSPPQNPLCWSSACPQQVGGLGVIPPIGWPTAPHCPNHFFAT